MRKCEKKLIDIINSCENKSEITLILLTYARKMLSELVQSGEVIELDHLEDIE